MFTLNAEGLGSMEAHSSHIRLLFLHLLRNGEYTGNYWSLIVELVSK